MEEKKRQAWNRRTAKWRLQRVEVNRGDDGEMSRRREGRTREGEEGAVNPFAELRCFGGTVMSLKQQTI